MILRNKKAPLLKTLTLVCSAYCVRSLVPAGECNHWASVAFASEDPPQLGWVQDGRSESSGLHMRRSLNHHLGKDAAEWVHTGYSPEVCSEQR